MIGEVPVGGRPLGESDVNVRHPALVLGLGDTGLAVVRALGRAGIVTHGVDRRRRIGFRSRYVKARICPDPKIQHEAFVAHLVSFARASDAPPVLFVTADVFLDAVARAWTRLSDHFLLLAPPPAVVNCFLDKHHLHRWCVDAGIAAPRSVHVTSPNGLGSEIDALTFPVFVKPSTAATRSGSFAGSAKGEVAHDPAEIRRIVAGATREGGDVIIQEVVQGPDTSCFKYCALVASDGRRLLEFTMQKIRNFPAHFGVGSCCVSRLEPEVLALGREVFERTGYRGVGSIEFKRDQRDGRLRLIEVNARYWQQVALPTACGLNFPATHYLEATGQAPGAVTEFTSGVKWLDLTADLASCLEYQREGTLTWTGWRQSLRGPMVSSDFDWSDMWPAALSARPWKSAARGAALLGRFLVR